MGAIGARLANARCAVVKKSPWHSGRSLRCRRLHVGNRDFDLGANWSDDLFCCLHVGDG